MPIETVVAVTPMPCANPPPPAVAVPESEPAPVVPVPPLPPLVPPPAVDSAPPGPAVGAVTPDTSPAPGAVPSAGPPSPSVPATGADPAGPEAVTPPWTVDPHAVESAHRRTRGAYQDRVETRMGPPGRVTVLCGFCVQPGYICLVRPDEPASRGWAGPTKRSRAIPTKMFPNPARSGGARETRSRDHRAGPRCVPCPDRL